MIGVQNARIFIVFLVLDRNYTANTPFLILSLRIGLIPFQYGDLETVLEFINIIVSRGKKYGGYSQRAFGKASHSACFSVW